MIPSTSNSLLTSQTEPFKRDPEEDLKHPQITDIKKPIISPILQNKGSSIPLHQVKTLSLVQRNKNIKLKCPLDLRALLIIDRPFFEYKGL